MTVEIVVRNEEETDVLGGVLARTLPEGAVVALLGTLGAGKTRLVQGVAQALGVSKEDVGSPTFVLIREYYGKERSIYHFDAYRLRDSDEFLALGVDEYFDSDGISFVEWADRVEDAVPRHRVDVHVEPLDATTRRFTISAQGEFDPEFEEKTRALWEESIKSFKRD